MNYKDIKMGDNKKFCKVCSKPYGVENGYVIMDLCKHVLLENDFNCSRLNSSIINIMSTRIDVGELDYETAFKLLAVAYSNGITNIKNYIIYLEDNYEKNKLIRFLNEFNVNTNLI